MKILQTKKVALKDVIPQTANVFEGYLNLFRDILGSIFIMEVADSYQSYEVKSLEDPQNVTNEAKDRFDELMGKLDVSYIRGNLEALSQNTTFQDFTRKLIGNDVLPQLNDSRNNLRSLFYQIFCRKLKAFIQTAEAGAFKTELTERGTLLLKLKGLGIEVYEEVEKGQEWSNDELREIFKAVCDISYANQVYLTLVKTLTLKPLPDEEHLPFELESGGRLFVRRPSASGSLRNVIYRAFGYAIQKDTYILPWHVSRKFKVLWWLSRKLSFVLGNLSFAVEPIYGEADDFAAIFALWHLNRQSLLDRAKRFRAILLRRKLKLLLPVLE